MYDRYNFVYILTNKRHAVLYTGVTNNLSRRIWEHKTKRNRDSFASKYNCDQLVFYDGGPEISGAISREKEIKGWRREKKVKLINSFNPEWKDLSEEILF